MNESHLVKYNIILVGGPASNALAAQFYEKNRLQHTEGYPAELASIHLPVSFTFSSGKKGAENSGAWGRQFHLGSCRRDNSHAAGVLFLGSRWEGGRAGELGGTSKDGEPRLVMVIAGSDSSAHGLRAALALAIPTIPPMTRASYCNLVRFPVWGVKFLLHILFTDT